METIALVDLVASWVWRVSWQASVLVLIILAVQWLCRSKLTPAWRYALWVVVLARLCLPVSWPSAWSVFNYTKIDAANARALQALLERDESLEAARLEGIVAEPSSGPSRHGKVQLFQILKFF